MHLTKSLERDEAITIGDDVFSVWERIMRGEFKLPTKFTGKPVKSSQKAVALDNDVYSSPYEIRVRPPSTYIAPASSVSGQSKLNDEANLDVSDNVSVDDNSSQLTIIRLGRSIPTDSDDLHLLSEQDANELSRHAV